jgi:hypothetical protein
MSSANAIEAKKRLANFTESEAYRAIDSEDEKWFNDRLSKINDIKEK